MGVLFLNFLLEEPSKRKERLPLSILVPLISVFALTCTITCVYVWRRKMAKEEGNGLAFHNAHHAQLILGFCLLELKQSHLSFHVIIM
jgi:hypothetical protein